MGRQLPVWLFLLCLLLASLFALFFGWSVKNTIVGGTHLGRLGEVSVIVASFPDLVSESVRAMRAESDEWLRVPRTSADLADFHPVRMKSDIHVQGLMVRADAAAMARAPGWRLLVGAFVVNGELNHAALALSPKLEIEKVWVFREEGIEGKEPRPTGVKLIHGFALLRDGSMIVAWTLGDSLERFDRCGRKVWSTRGIFDHAVGLVDDEKFVWTLSNDYQELSELVKVATETGEIVQRISMASISAANPTIDVLGARRHDDGYADREHPRWLLDPFHVNDVEPLSAALSDRFEGFAAGDLLLSLRSLNLVLVVDPETLKVKWWQGGATRRQHDPDWQPTGEITVYDNRLGHDYSQIVSIDPASHSTRVVFDGRSNDFYSTIMGEHQITKAGNILITSPRQGRAFEVDRNGQIVFEIFNNKPGNKEFGYFLSQAIWLPPETFDFTKGFPCAK